VTRPWARAARLGGGCAGQGERRCGSQRRSGVGGVVGRDRRGSVPTAEGGQAATGEAPRYPVALRAGGSCEAEPNEGEMGRRAHNDSSYLGEGTAQFAVRGGASMLGAIGKATGTGSCPWGASE
jgi:hypothetical protein